jgi:hypothetical protein
MRNRKWILGTIAAFIVAAPAPARASHHLWKIQQLFSNSSGTVQFVELETTSGLGRTGETNVGGFMLVTNGNSFTFGNNVTPGPSGATQWLLLSTASAASLPGAVPPDFIIPPNFFATGGGSMTYADNRDTWNYGTVPTDGVHALAKDPDTATVSTIVNQPINLLGAAGQLNLAPSTPAVSGWALALCMGGLLLAGSGLLRRRAPAAAV